MIYLKVAQTNDNDADYFSFSDIHTALQFIDAENISGWQMSDILFEESFIEKYVVPETDYTYVDCNLDYTGKH